MMLTSIVLLLAAAYCLARAFADLRQRRVRWGLAGIASFVAILVVPIQTHAVKVTLPVNNAN